MTLGMDDQGNRIISPINRGRPISLIRNELCKHMSMKYDQAKLHARAHF